MQIHLLNLKATEDGEFPILEDGLPFKDTWFNNHGYDRFVVPYGSGCGLSTGQQIFWEANG